VAKGLTFWPKMIFIAGKNTTKIYYEFFFLVENFIMGFNDTNEV